MTPAQIESRKAKEVIVFDTARDIRQLLNGAREAYGADAWDADSLDDRVIELVTEDVDE